MKNARFPLPGIQTSIIMLGSCPQGWSAKVHEKNLVIWQLEGLENTTANQRIQIKQRAGPSNGEYLKEERACAFGSLLLATQAREVSEGIKFLGVTGIDEFSGCTGR